MPILTRDKFLELFPNSAICGGRYKLNAVKKSINTINNVSLTKAESLNGPKEKRDIFFTPNGDYKKSLQENSGKGKSKKLALEGNIYSFSIDSDDGGRPREEIGMKPTIIVKTNRGYHMHFLLKNPVSADEYIKRRENLQEKLIQLLRGDNNAKDIARLFRVPGFKYWADNIGETEIKVEEYNPEEKRSFDEREDEINGLHEVVCSDMNIQKAITKKVKDNKALQSFNEIFKDIAEVNAADVLVDLYGGYTLAAGNKIAQDGKITSGFKYWPSKNFVKDFSHDDRPRGGPYKLAKDSMKDNDLVLDYFETRRGVKPRKIINDLESSKEIQFKEVDLKSLDNDGNIKDYKAKTFGSNGSGIIINELKCEITGFNADGSTSPFIDALLEPVGRVIDGDFEKFIIRIKKKTGEEIVTSLPISGTNTEFRKFLQKYGLMIPDNSKHFIYLFQYVYAINKKIYYTNKLGLQEFGGKKVIVKKSGIYLDEENNVFVDIPDGKGHEIVVEENDTTIKEYCKQLEEGYDKVISIPMFLTMCIGVNSYYFRNYRFNIPLPQSFLFGISQSGKALKGSTEIPMANGEFKQIRDIKEGDLIVGGDGTPATVLGKFNPNQQEVYNVLFDDGSSVECCADHLRQVRNIYRTEKKVLSTKQLIEGGVMKGNCSRYAIDLEQIQYQEKEYTISPYTLGAWLGDGSSDCSKIWIKHGDEAIVDNIKEDIHIVDVENGCSKYWIEGLTKKLRELNLLQNKHIPNEYLTGSREQRLELLAGLLDTDGTVSARGATTVSISTSIKRMADDIGQLINSLGWKYDLYVRTPKYTYKGKKKEGKLEYRISFYPDTPVFKLKRQNDKTKFNRLPSRRYIRSITPITKEEEYYCIQVDSIDKTFMCTRSYIKTHNTTLLDLMFLSFGIRKNISALSKAFIYEKNARHYIPIHFSEYRNSGHNQSELIEGFLRNLFDGTPIEKGRADQGVNDYPSNAQYVLDGQTIFTDDAVQTRLVLLLANKRHKGDINKLRNLPNIFNEVANIFKDMDDFTKFFNKAQAETQRIIKNMKLKRGDQRILDSFGYILALAEWLDLGEYRDSIIEALETQDGLTVQDDIQETYNKAFNLQFMYNFDCSLHKSGMIINIVEDGIRLNTNLKDLKGMIQTINANFIGMNYLSGLSVFIDFDYIFKHEHLRGGFIRMMSSMSLGTLEPKDKEEAKALGSLRQFLLKNCKNTQMLQDLNYEINYFKNNDSKKGKEVSFD